MAEKASRYLLSVDAKNDLAEIADYTLRNWGLEIFKEYRDGLKTVFQSIANHTIIKKSFSNNLADVFVTKYRYHFIFYIQKDQRTVIIGVIHEQRDLVHQLTHRLN